MTLFMVVASQFLIMIWRSKGSDCGISNAKLNRPISEEIKLGRQADQWIPMLSVLKPELIREYAKISGDMSIIT